MQEIELNNNDLGFSEADYNQIAEQGIPLELIRRQLNFYKTGIPKTVLVVPATVTNGIVRLSQDEIQQKANLFDANKSTLTLNKFVPASGAASRMFQFLNEFLNEFDIDNESINGYINRKKDSELSIFIVGLEKFPFYNEVKAILDKTVPNFNHLESDYKNYYFIKTMLSADYFNFANKPKAILPFHKYENHISSPIEEHLYECANYASSNGHSHLHFTISETHQNEFEIIVNTIKDSIEKETETIINISYSNQNKKTDTITVDLENNPLRDASGKLVFRPGGHGALIENLNLLDADIIFIKNIDNVIHCHNENQALYKKCLAGVLIELQQKIFNYLYEIEKANKLDLDEILTFTQNFLNIKIIDGFSKYTTDNKIKYLNKILNRPIRVCGMVKNEGDTGGAPFWVRNSKGRISLQIVETSQVDLANAEQAKIFAKATHFNPVDLVCGIRNYKNERFDLTHFVDHKSGFVVQKNKDGKLVKGYELPGLWNGGMAKWITIFVEVPLTTFNPVKTVNDLLKAQHQPH